MSPSLLLALVVVNAHGDDDFQAVDGHEAEHLQAHSPPQSFLEFLTYLAPVFKYYVILLGFYAVARHFNRMVEDEDNLKEKELSKRPNLSHDLMKDSEDEEESEEDEEDEEDENKKNAMQQKLQKFSEDDDIHEELITDGSKLVKMSENELKERKKTKQSKSKNHPLFEGLQKIEEELKQKKEQDDDDDAHVSWNELHQSMLKRYQQKYPEHGLRVQKGDDYDDEFKELLKKHNIDPDEIKKEISKDK